MEKNKSKVEFSLDCELLWGMKKGVSDKYIEKNVSKSHDSLNEIVTQWEEGYPSLYLAFVGNSIPAFDECTEKNLYLIENGYEKFLSKKYLTFDKFDFKVNKENIKLGMHSLSHRLYTELDDKEKKSEVEGVVGFISQQEAFSKIFVYPKNLADEGSVSVYESKFENIRVNSNSWLYRTDVKGVGKVKRLLRYADSFVPIYEFFCDKKPEHSLKNVVVGTHFFRGNLPDFLLYVHYYRLILGMKIMRLSNKKMHVWSHPHNFGANQKAIKLFCNLAK